MKIVKRNLIGFSIFASVFIILYDYFKIRIYPITYHGSSTIEETFYLMLLLIPYAIYLILAIWFLLQTIIGLERLKWKAFMPTAIIIITILILIYVPYTNVFANLNFTISKENYLKTVQMYKEDQLSFYSDDRYEVPYDVSYTGLVYVQDKSDIIKIRFDIYKGFTKYKTIIYTSDDSGIYEDDFMYSGKFSDVRKITNHWYSATLSQ